MKFRDIDQVEQEFIKREKRITKKPLRDSERTKENVRQARRNKTSQKWG